MLFLEDAYCVHSLVQIKPWLEISPYSHSAFLKWSLGTQQNRVIIQMKTDSLLDVASRSPIPSSTSPCLLQPLPSPSPCLQPPGMDGPIALQHSKHRQRSSALESEGNVWLKKRNAQFQCLCSFRKDQIPFSRFEEFQRKDRDLPC